MEATKPPPGPVQGLSPQTLWTDQDEERRLLAAIGRGDRSAAGELVDRTYGLVYGALVRMAGEADLAADLTQEVYRKAWASLPRFRGSSRLATWLYRIAYTTFLNHQRRPRPLTPLTDSVAAVLDDPAPGPEQTAARGAEHQALRRAVFALPDELRYTVSAHYWGDLPVSEIARQEGITGAAVRKRLKRAKTLLAASIEEDA